MKYAQGGVVKLPVLLKIQKYFIYFNIWQRVAEYFKIWEAGKANNQFSKFDWLVILIFNVLSKSQGKKMENVTAETVLF